MVPEKEKKPRRPSSDPGFVVLTAPPLEVHNRHGMIDVQRPKLGPRRQTVPAIAGAPSILSKYNDLFGKYGVEPTAGPLPPASRSISVAQPSGDTTVVESEDEQLVEKVQENILRLTLSNSILLFIRLSSLFVINIPAKIAKHRFCLEIYVLIFVRQNFTFFFGNKILISR